MNTAFFWTKPDIYIYKDIYAAYFARIVLLQKHAVLLKGVHVRHLFKECIKNLVVYSCLPSGKRIPKQPTCPSWETATESTAGQRQLYSCTTSQYILWMPSQVYLIPYANHFTWIPCRDIAIEYPQWFVALGFWSSGNLVPGCCPKCFTCLIFRDMAIEHTWSQSR